MAQTIAGLTPLLRRYSHALLGAWPPAPRRQGGTRPRFDQDADDIVHEALLELWRSGARGFSLSNGASDPVANPLADSEDGLRLALYRRLTILARRHVTAQAAAERHSATCLDSEAEDIAPTPHFAWAPEKRALPRIPLELRAVLALISLEGLTYAQAGVVLDMAPDRILARLAVARARFAGEIAGAPRAHLVAVAPCDMRAGQRPISEGELHRFVDDLLGDARRDAVLGFLESNPVAARRVAEWRRQSERLRQAFAPLMGAPVPVSLDFAPRESGAARGWRASASPRHGFLGRIAALFGPPDLRAGAASGPL